MEVRALPAGLLLLALTRILPSGIWIVRSLVFGALNFSIFWWLLFIAAYQLLGESRQQLVQYNRLLCLFLQNFYWISICVFGLCLGCVWAVFGLCLGCDWRHRCGPSCSDTSRYTRHNWSFCCIWRSSIDGFRDGFDTKWQPLVTALIFTSWQLTAAGLLLLPAMLWFEPALPDMTMAHVAGFAYLGIIGGAITYFLWFRGIAKLGPSTVAPLGLLSLVTAVLCGWLVLGQTLSPTQGVGLFSSLLVFGQVSAR